MADALVMDEPSRQPLFKLARTAFALTYTEAEFLATD
jgi:hypothetical protein